MGAEKCSTAVVLSDISRTRTGSGRAGAQAKAWNEEVQEIYEELATIRAAEEWRAEQAAKALARGDWPRRWGKLVPIGCAQNRHRWHQRGGPTSLKTCLDCHGHLGDDGVTVSWPDFVAAALGRAVSEPAPREWRNRSDQDADVVALLTAAWVSDTDAGTELLESCRAVRRRPCAGRSRAGGEKRGYTGITVTPRRVASDGVADRK